MTDRVFHLLTFLCGAVAGGLLVNSLKPDPHTWMLVGVMVAGGLFGGGVNFFLAKADDPATASLARSLFVGVGAALLVPLFLHIMSSNLLDSTRGEPLSVLVFFGFCLIAAISSRAFITTISERILRKVEEAADKAERASDKAEAATRAAAEARAEVQPLVTRHTEPEVTVPAAGEMESLAETHTGNGSAHAEARLLQALASGKWALRSMSGLSRELNLPLGTVRAVLQDLEGRGMIASQPGRSGAGERWFITEEGLRRAAPEPQL